MKSLRRQRPSGIATLAFFEFLGALSCIGLLFFIPLGSRDFIALSVGAVLGFVVVYSLWTLQFLAFLVTAVYESLEIVYEIFFLTPPYYRKVDLLCPLFLSLLRCITLCF